MRFQSAQDSSPKHAAHQTVHSGQTGDLAGTVSDQTGAVIPNVVIVASNQKTGMEFEEKSDDQGNYLMESHFRPASTKSVSRSRGFMDLVYDQSQHSLPLNTVTLDRQSSVSVGSVSESC